MTIHLSIGEIQNTKGSKTTGLGILTLLHLSVSEKHSKQISKLREVLFPFDTIFHSNRKYPPKDYVAKSVSAAFFPTCSQAPALMVTSALHLKFQTFHKTAF